MEIQQLVEGFLEESPAGPFSSKILSTANADKSKQPKLTPSGVRHFLGAMQSFMDDLGGDSQCWCSNGSSHMFHPSLTILEQAFLFAIHLSRSEGELAQIYAKEFPQVKLSVYQTMHTARSFGAKSHPQDDGMIDCADFEKVQLNTARKITAATQGRMQHFVAWTPFVSKDDWDEDMPKALKIIDDAIKAGAVGVKFYPPLGYRPSCNEQEGFPPRPWQPWAGERQRQWDERYKPCEGKPWSGRELDLLNGKLFAYCIKHDIPILSHCHTGEFRCSSNAHELVNPIFWKAVLEQPEFRKLRLCLGHAGGPAFWTNNTKTVKSHTWAGSTLFGRTLKQEDWGKLVSELVVTYPNVYCEMGIHDESSNPALGASFAARMIELNKVTGEGGSFAKKVMYGSDWFMPIATSPREYVEGFRRVYTLPELRDHYRDFFARNALTFLNLDRRMKEVPSLKPSASYLKKVAADAEARP